MCDFVGYHTYDLAKFEIDAVGEHKTYLFFFTQDNTGIQKFAEAIGPGAVSVTSGVNDVDWMFMHCLPVGYTPHAIWYSTILVICPSRKTASQFLGAYKGISFLKRVMTGDQPARDFGNLAQTCIVFVPREDKPTPTIGALARYIETGRPGALVDEERYETLNEELRNITGLRCHLHGNCIFVETARLLEPVVEEGRQKLDELYKLLNQIRTDLAGIDRTRDTDELLKNLKALRRELAKSREENGGFKLELSAGFEAFGNSAKVVYESRNIPAKPLARLKELVRLVSDETA